MISYDDYRNFKQEFECIRNEFFQFKDMVRNLEQKTYIIDNEINNIKYQLNSGAPTPSIIKDIDLIKHDIQSINKQIGIIMNDIDAE